jgi:hypothetical protein
MASAVERHFGIPAPIVEEATRGLAGLQDAWG